LTEDLSVTFDERNAVYDEPAVAAAVVVDGDGQHAYDGAEETRPAGAQAYDGRIPEAIESVAAAVVAVAAVAAASAVD